MPSLHEVLRLQRCGHLHTGILFVLFGCVNSFHFNISVFHQDVLTTYMFSLEMGTCFLSFSLIQKL
jgi:hypothetical protein